MVPAWLGRSEQRMLREDCEASTLARRTPVPVAIWNASQAQDPAVVPWTRTSGHLVEGKRIGLGQADMIVDAVEHETLVA